MSRNVKNWRSLNLKLVILYAFIHISAIKIQNIGAQFLSMFILGISPIGFSVKICYFQVLATFHSKAFKMSLINYFSLFCKFLWLWNKIFQNYVHLLGFFQPFSYMDFSLRCDGKSQSSCDLLTWGSITTFNLFIS